MAEIIDASYQGSKDDKGKSSNSLLEDSIFAMRGFGSFDVTVGV